jgi:hypothetical protein
MPIYTQILLRLSAAMTPGVLRGAACNGIRKEIMKKLVDLVRIFGVWMVCLGVFSGGARAADEAPLPGEVVSGAEHLLSLVGPGNGEKFQPERIAGLMDFVIRPKQQGVRFSDISGTGLSSSYTEVDVRIRLADLLQYSFNPSIPWFATTPSSLRTSSWKQTDKPWTGLPRLWELLATADSPVVVRGLEAVENTPDIFSGAYYRYDLHRTLILFARGERRTAISISKQADVSDVGRKGYIVGKDQDWNYFYSGEPGLNIAGLGWVKSHMFDSAGISVYTEEGQAPALVRTANFKWLRGGWSNINVIQNDHIHQGMLRFARAFKEVLESPRLPAVKTLEDACGRIANLTDAALRDKMKTYRQIMTARAERLEGGARRHLPEAFFSEDYWQGLKREEMESILVLETLKAYLGRSPESDWRSLVMLPSPQAYHQGG